jgi:hypothetical protein
MPCKYRWGQISTVNGALRTMGLSSFSLNLPVVSELRALRYNLLSQVTGPFPRASVLIRMIIGLSPGSVRMWLDTENGWMCEGRKSPGSTPVYHSITKEEAAALLQEHPDEALAHRMMEPDGYIGE